MLRERGLPVSGKKADLLRRLETAGDDILRNDGSVRERNVGSTPEESDCDLDETWVKKGMRVEVERGGIWCKGRVIQAPPYVGTCTVAFDSEGDIEHDVDVASRLRRTVTTDEHYRASRVSLGTLKQGQQLEGNIVKTTPSGIFVDVGAEIDGFVHASGVVRDGRKQVEVGQAVDTWVIEVTGDNKLKLAMAMSQVAHGELQVPSAVAQPSLSSRLAALATLRSSDWLEGVVGQAEPTRLLVDVVAPCGGLAVQGMVHMTEIREGFVEDARQEAKVGQEVRVRVLDVDQETRTLTLSMKQDPGLSLKTHYQDLSGLQHLPASAWLTAVVTGTALFGILVYIRPPDGSARVHGLVHVTCIPEEEVDILAVKIGDEVPVRILSLDLEQGRLLLTMKGE